MNDFTLWTIFLSSTLTALTISFICSLLEACLLSLTPTQIAEMTEKHPQASEIWRDFKEHIDQPIAIVLIINTTAHTIGATFAGIYFEKLFGNAWIALFSIIFTYLMLQFTEILPKGMGCRYNTFLAPYIAFPLKISIRLLTPLTYVIHIVNRLFQHGESDLIPDPLSEISILAHQASVDNQISVHQERIIKETSELGEQEVKDLMIPVESIIFLSTTMSLSDALIASHSDPHTRFPICENDDKNKIIGYVNFKELVYALRVNPHNATLRGIARPIQFTSAERGADDLLHSFIERHEHIAIVQEPNGETIGLVTFEDIVERLVGKLGDEFDRPPTLFHPLPDNIWMVGGGITIERISNQLQIEFLDADPKQNLSSYLIQKFRRLPKNNETIQIDNRRFMIRRIRRNQIFEVCISCDKTQDS